MGTRPCGEYEISSSGPDFTGSIHYFRDGEHVATQYWTDIGVYCGGFTYWYGREIRCEPASTPDTGGPT